MNGVPEPESESTEPPSAAPPGQEDLLGRRIGAALIDLALLVAVFAILAATIGESTVGGGGFSFELNGTEAALYLALVLLYYFALEAALGQTVGKLLLGLRVVRTDGSRPSVAAIAVRTLLRVPDWLPFLYLVGFIAMLATGLRRQRLGDLAAKTSVSRALPVRHRGLAAAAVALVALVLLGVSFYRATISGGGESTYEEGLSDLRVCADQAYDEGEEECTEDQREQPLKGRTVYCSAKVEGREGEQFRARFLYEGELYFTGGRTLPAGAGTVWGHVGVDGGLLPGGRWACELSVGSEKMEASFESAGPTAPVLNIAVCLTANTVTEAPRVCRQDESGAPLGPTVSVTCSATIVGETGKLVRIDFLYEGREIGGPSELESPGSISRFSVPLTAEPDPLPEGDYACRFSLAGGQVGEKRFSIAG